MIDPRKVLIRLLVSTAILALSSSAYAASEKKVEPVGRTTVSVIGVDWQAAGDNESITLVVKSPTGEIYRKEFTGRTQPNFRISDLKQLEEGIYTYELRVTPRVSATVKKQLDTARKANDDAAIKRIQKTAGLGTPAVQSGAFTVLNGGFVPNDLVETTAKDSATAPARVTPSTDGSLGGQSGYIGGSVSNGLPKFRPTVNDQVIPDDLIVQGSGCFGFDCVNNESFGFDTIRLKENNLRINFDDTSASAGFPANDWQIVANDSASGGNNYLSFLDSTNSRTPFTVEAGAPNNTLYVDSTGNVGLSTSTPGLDLHISATDTPAIRQEQTNAGGFTAQTWDIGGNEANWFVRDLTAGSKLIFRLRPGAPTSSIDVAASGNVGFGTAAPTQRIDLRSSSATADIFGFIGSDPTNGPGMIWGHAGGGGGLGRGAAVINSIADPLAAAPNPSVRILIAGAQKFIIDNQGYLGLGITDPSVPIHVISGAFLSTGGVWTDASSRAFKQDIENLGTEEALATFEKLTPVKYAYKAEPDEHHVGFIAEDVPELVATKERKGLAPMDVVAVLTKVVQEQQKTIEQLNQRLEQLEKKDQ